MKAIQIRQGDVLLVPVDDERPPDGAERSKEIVLAEGELTGHSHKVTAEAGIVRWENMICVLGNEPGLLSHEDHDPEPAPVVLAGQTYQIVIQREHTLSGQWRKVVD